MSNREEVAERLFNAVAEDNLVVVRQILFHHQHQQGGGGGVLVDHHIDRALIEAAHSGNVEAFDLLFNNGLSESGKQIYRSAENPSKYFPLHWAAFRSHTDMVKFIVQDCQCNTNRLNDQGISPLYIAARSATEISRILVENGADPNKCGHNNWMKHPLFGALLSDDDDVVRLLLEHGADPNFQETNRHGYVPIETASVADQAIADANPERLDLLLQHGALLGVAFGPAGPWYICMMLHKTSHTPEKKLSTCGVLAKHATLNHGNVKECIQCEIDNIIGGFNACFGETLLQSGVIPRRQTMHFAILEGKVSICRMLIQNGVNPFQEEFVVEEWPPLSLFQTAATRENTEIFELFLDLWDDDRFSSTHHGGDNATMHVVCGYSKVSLQAIQLLIERQGHALMTAGRHQHHGLRPFLISSMHDANLDVIYTLLRHDPDALGRRPR